jgi:hypothetical protein
VREQLLHVEVGAKAPPSAVCTSAAKASRASWRRVFFTEVPVAQNLTSLTIVIGASEITTTPSSVELRQWVGRLAVLRFPLTMRVWVHGRKRLRRAAAQLGG